MVRNSFFGLFSQVLFIIVGFFSQRVLFLQAGRELVGMNSVISNILAILSVSELGISTAVVFHLYQALSHKKESEIAALMQLYRRAYIMFAFVITILGLAILPFVHVFLKHNHFSLSYIRLVYGMWLFRTVLSYLLSYKRSLIIADQKEYMVCMVTTAAGVLNYVLMIVIVGQGFDYVLALAANIFVEAAGNIGLSYYVDRAYPFLKKRKKESLPQTVVRRIFADVKNIFAVRLSAKLLTCTDSLIISGAIDVAAVGAYANYSLIIQSIINMVMALSNAVQPGMGALFTEHDRQKKDRALRLLTFVFYFVAVTAAMGLYTMMKPFICDLWLNEQSLPDHTVIVCCALNCFVYTIGQPLVIVMQVSGRFEKERKTAMAGAVVNLLVSLGLVRIYGIAGVLAGTGCAYLLQLMLRLWYFFDDDRRKRCGRYALDLAEYVLSAMVQLPVAVNITESVYHTGGFLRFLLAGGCCVCFSVGVNLVLFGRSERLAEVMRMIKGLINRKSV